MMAEISATLLATAITVVNDVTGKADRVKVTGLEEGDIVNVYSVATGGTVLGTATVAKDAIDATVSGIDLLRATGGRVYATVTKADKLEKRAYRENVYNGASIRGTSSSDHYSNEQQSEYER